MQTDGVGFSVPAVLENDVNSGALGEALPGGGRGAATVYYLTISSGIGSSIVIDGRIHRGRAGLAGEVWAFHPGSFTGLDTPNVNDTCSGTGMVMQAANRVRRGGCAARASDELSTRHIMRAAAEGDRVAGAASRRWSAFPRSPKRRSAAPNCGTARFSTAP